MDFYNAGRKTFFLTGLTKWWWFTDGSGERTLVVSVTRSQADLWVVTYTIVVGLIFIVACDLTTAIVLTTFKLGTSGTRHAMLVSYYNGGRPSNNVRPMLGYLWNALTRCKKKGKRTVDWSSFWASFGLFLLAVALVSGNVITKYFLGGDRLVVGNVAQANPDAVFYPSFDIGDDGSNPAIDVPIDIVDAFKGLVPHAVSQASARKTNAKQLLEERIQLIRNHTAGDAGAEAHFEYQYNLTGLEMGLRDATGLEFKVRGECSTHYGNDSIIYAAYNDPAQPKAGNIEAADQYPFYGNVTDRAQYSLVVLSREKYTAPWAQFVTRFDNKTQKQNLQYGGYTFMIVPHTAWRQSDALKKTDAWYETEENPAFVNGSNYNTRYRVKNGRPALRCTQNDTYTYNGHTVNHVNKLSQLPGLNSTLSPFIMNIVFGREFGSPVFSKLLGNLPFGTLESTSHFIPNNRRLDVTRASLDDDFEGLVYMSFVYSREVVRNTVLLYSTLQGRNDAQFNNAAARGDLAKNADFVLEGTEVAALSVFVLIVTPSVWLFLWLLLLLWNRCFNPGSALDNTSAEARHGLRLYGFQAVHLYRYLDEALSNSARKWSGRNTDTPYIRDLDAEEAAKQAAIQVEKQPAEQDVEKQPAEQDVEMQPAEQDPTGISPGDRISLYAKPKVVPVQGPPEPPRFRDMVLNAIKRIFCRGSKQTEGQRFEVAVTRVWNTETGPTKWKHIRRDA